MQFDASLFVPAWRRTWGIAATMPWTVAIAGLLTTALGVLSDIGFEASPEMGSGVSIVYAMALAGVQVWVTGAALERMGAKPALSIINALSLWLQSVLIGLGIILGLLLLILPGLYVAARWPAALAIALIMFFVSAVPLLLSFYPLPLLSGYEFAVLVAINMVASVGVIGGFLAAVALLTLIEPPTAELQEIFG